MKTVSVNSPDMDAAMKETAVLLGSPEPVRFQVTRYRDAWAAVLFGVSVVAVFGIGAYLFNTSWAFVGPAMPIYAPRPGDNQPANYTVTITSERASWICYTIGTTGSSLFLPDCGLQRTCSALSFLYDGPLHLYQSSVIQAVGCADSGKDGSTAQAWYTVGPRGKEGAACNVSADCQSNFCSYFTNTCVGSRSDICNNESFDVPLTTALYYSGGVAAFGVLSAVFWLVLMRAYPLQFIYLLMVLYAVLCIGGCGFLVYMEGLMWGIPHLLLCLLVVLLLWLLKRRFPFSAVILGKASGTVMDFKATLAVSVLCILANAVYLLPWIVILLATTSQWQYVVLMFFLYWTQQVCTNVSHTTTSGVCATVFFAGGPRAAAMPANPTLGSLRRACTYSFGSICFGSLIVAILKTLRLLCRLLASRRSFVACCMQCLIGYLEGLMEYYNTYAYVEVAMYGKPFREAGRAVWELCKTSGVDAVLNDLVINHCLNTAAFLSCAASATGLGFIVAKTWPSDCSRVLMAVVFGSAGFLVAYLVHVVVFTVIQSAVVTYFVCFAQEPETLQATDPELFAQITQKREALRRGRLGTSKAAKPAPKGKAAKPQQGKPASSSNGGVTPAHYGVVVTAAASTC